MKKSIDVLYYLPRFYPAISGAEFYILNLAKELTARLKKVQILSSTSIDFKGLHHKDGLHIDSSHPNYNSYENIPIYRVPPQHTFFERESEQLQRIQNQYLGRSMQQLLENGPNHTQYFLNFRDNPPFTPKLIHSSYLPYATVLFALLLCKEIHIPSVCTPFLHMNNPRYQDDIYLPVLKNYDHIITCTECEKKYLKNRGISLNLLSTIPMGVDHNIYEKFPTSRSGRKKSFKKAFEIRRPFALYCGYKNFEKGAISVLHATECVHKKIPELLYVFIGPSTHAFDFELKKVRKKGIPILNLTPENLTGYYDWRKIAAFQECEMYIMPSRSDAYGISYLEAWASKKPVIGADFPVMHEIIEHNKDGLLVEFDNIVQISEAITDLYYNKSKATEMGVNGYIKTKKHNTWKAVYEKTWKVYSELVNFND